MSSIYDSGQWEGVYSFMPKCMCVQDLDDYKWKCLVEDSEPGVLRVPSLSSSPSHKALVAAVHCCSHTLSRGKGKALMGSSSCSDLRSRGS